MKTINELSNNIKYNDFYQQLFKSPIMKYFNFEELDISDTNVCTYWECAYYDKLLNKYRKSFYDLYIGKLKNNFYFISGYFFSPTWYKYRISEIKLKATNTLNDKTSFFIKNIPYYEISSESGFKKKLKENFEFRLTNITDINKYITFTHK